MKCQRPDWSVEHASIIFICLWSLSAPPPQAQLIQMVVWMLQRRLLIQLHTYACLLVPPSEDEDDRLKEEEPPLAARVGGRSLSTPNALSFGSPSTAPSLTD